MSTFEFGSADEILRSHPDDQRFPPESTAVPREGSGVIGSSLYLPNGQRAISVFVGAGRRVVISEDGKYIGDNHGQYEFGTENGAWISESLWCRAAHDFHANH